MRLQNFLLLAFICVVEFFSVSNKSNRLFAQVHLDWTKSYPNENQFGNETKPISIISDTNSVYTIDTYTIDTNNFKRYDKAGNLQFANTSDNYQNSQFNNSGNIIANFTNLIYTLDGAGNSTNFFQTPNTLIPIRFTIDIQSNFYGVSAHPSNSLTVSKFTQSNVIWSSVLTDTTNNHSVTSITLDSIGNTFISGTTAGKIGAMKIGGQDGYIAKFDNSGGLSWTIQYNNAIPTSYETFFNDMAIDSAGNIFVAGMTYLGNNSNDALLLKFDTSGNLLWSKTYDSGNLLDSAEKIVIDKNGHVYIAGTFGTLSEYTGNQLFIAKYDTNGNMLSFNELESGPNAGFGYGTVNTIHDFSYNQDGHLYLAGSRYSEATPSAIGSNFYSSYSIVPEPSSLLATGFSCLGLIILFRKKFTHI